MLQGCFLYTPTLYWRYNIGMVKQVGFTHLVVAILISVLAVGMVGAAWWYEENKEGVNTEKNELPFSEIAELSINSIEWKKIRYDTHAGYSLELTIPKNWDCNKHQDDLIERGSLFSINGAISHPIIQILLRLRFYNNDETFETWVDKHEFEFTLPQWQGRQYYRNDIEYGGIPFSHFNFDNTNDDGFYFFPIGNAMYEINVLKPIPGAISHKEISPDIFPSYFTIIPKIFNSITIVRDADQAISDSSQYPEAQTGNVNCDFNEAADVIYDESN